MCLCILVFSIILVYMYSVNLYCCRPLLLFLIIIQYEMILFLMFNVIIKEYDCENVMHSVTVFILFKVRLFKTLLVMTIPCIHTKIDYMHRRENIVYGI